MIAKNLLLTFFALCALAWFALMTVAFGIPEIQDGDWEGFRGWVFFAFAPLLIGTGLGFCCGQRWRT